MPGSEHIWQQQRPTTYSLSACFHSGSTVQPLHLLRCARTSRPCCVACGRARRLSQGRRPSGLGAGGPPLPPMPPPMPPASRPPRFPRLASGMWPRPAQHRERQQERLGDRNAARCRQHGAVAAVANAVRTRDVDHLALRRAAAASAASRPLLLLIVGCSMGGMRCGRQAVRSLM